MPNDMIFYGKRVCFIGAHPDDIEIGCGAMIAQINSQAEVLCITLSDNQKNPDLKNLIEEHYASMEILGVKRDRIQVKNFETRRFPHYRQEILEYLFEINRTFKPEIVFVPKGMFITSPTFGSSELEENAYVKIDRPGGTRRIGIIEK